MILVTIDGKRLIRINYVLAQRKMARAAMLKGDRARAQTHFRLIRNAKGK